jgi:aminomuconate-semialdehyde/2-hydroxymuconate-6-semialdehyde dehydrogenase
MRLTHHIGGEATEPASGRWLDVHEPATGSLFAQCAAGSEADVERAVRAGEAAFPAWAALPPSQRARWLERLADALEQRAEAFGQAESRDGGKPLALARDVEIPRAVANLRFFAAAATQFASESHHGEARLK